jgi:hypothetical protein
LGCEKGSLLRKDKKRMNFIHAGPFDSALRAPLRMTALLLLPLTTTLAADYMQSVDTL